MQEGTGTTRATAGLPLLSAPDEATVIARTATRALASIDGCDHAAVSLLPGRRTPRDPHFSDPTAAAADALQDELREGPRFAHQDGPGSVRSGDVATGDRWPTWARRAEDELDIRSVLSIPLSAGPRRYGALTLYSSTRHGFSARAQADAEELAAHAAHVLAVRREIDTLQEAVASRHVIGQAQGVLMERFGLDVDQAFAYLTRLSSSLQRPVRDLAAQIAGTGVVPTIQKGPGRDSPPRPVA